MKNNQLTSNESSGEVYEARPESYGRTKLFDLVRQVSDELKPLVEELEKYWPMMPKVAGDGSSECPFAEDMYRSKEELEIKIAKKLAVLCDFQGQMTEEVGRCKRNLVRISYDVKKLNDQLLKKQYDKGFCLQEREYSDAIWYQQQVDKLVLRAQATLSASRRKEYPIRLTGEGGIKGMPGSGSVVPAPKGPKRVGPELNDLIQLGQLPKGPASDRP